MAYATASDMTARYDARLIGDLLADDGTRVASGSISGNANLTAALDDASGEIEAALLMGGRYTTAQLSALTGNSAKHLVRITCDIAMAFLWGRRGAAAGAKAEQRAGAEAIANGHLERLRKGETIFDVDGLVDAANPTIDGPSTATLTNLNLISRRTRRYFPAQRLPNGR